jgi:membrane protease YdiL (CAAX protease family)
VKLSRKKLIFFGSMIASAAVTHYLTTDSTGVSADVLAFMFTLLLLVGFPALTIMVELRRKKEGVARTQSRVRVFVTVLSIEFLLAMIALALLTAQTGDFNFNWTGLRVLGPVSFLSWFAVLLIGLFLIGRVMGFMRARRWLGARAVPDRFHPKPVTRLEKGLWYFAVAPVVGVSEEFLYRIYLFNEIPNLWHTHPLVLAWVMSSVAFGLAHVHKDFSRLWGATAVGFLLGSPVVFSGSVFPSMAAHALYDALTPHVPPYREIAKATASNP